jgi:hypothetical protein
MEREDNDIERDFILSWDLTEEIFKFWNLHQKGNVFDLIYEMRQHGYDKTLRAGQSIMYFVVSRSRKHGLRPDQPHIVFDFETWHGLWQQAEALSKLGQPHSYPSTVDISLHNMNGDRKLMISEIKFTPEIDTILKQLESFPID